MNHEAGSPHSRSKLQQVLGGRFVERIHNELSVMRAQLRAAREGDASAVEQLLQFAHRIGGAAAMLGFAQIGEPVRSIERILRAGVLSPAVWVEIEHHLQQLQTAVGDAGENLIT